jgi:hypothetical protein
LAQEGVEHEVWLRALTQDGKHLAAFLAAGKDDVPDEQDRAV